MLPAQQRLHAGDLAGVHFHQRLVMQHKLVPSQRLSQSGFEFQAPRRAHIEFRGIELEIVPAHLFGVVHGDVGVLQQIFGAVVIEGIECDAD